MLPKRPECGWDRRTPFVGVKLAPKVRQLLELPYHVQRSQGWFDERKDKSITASDAASALGINPYCTRANLFRKKTGQLPPQASNPATRHGTTLEEEAIIRYEQEYKKTCFIFGCTTHPKFPWLGGSPDAVTADGILVEVKCPYSREIEHRVPDWYYPQVQLLLEIHDLELAHFVQYKPATFTTPEILDVVEVLRDREWFKINLPAFESFHNEVQAWKTRLAVLRESSAVLIQWWWRWRKAREEKGRQETKAALCYLYSRLAWRFLNDRTFFEELVGWRRQTYLRAKKSAARKEASRKRPLPEDESDPFPLAPE